MGADRKANTRGAGSSAGRSLLERLQGGVALEALSESSSSFETEAVVAEPARTGTEVGAEFSGVNGR